MTITLWDRLRAGWASEARWFIRPVELSDGCTLVVHPEISPDGLFWCAEGSAGLRITEPVLASLKLRDFGQWLRLRCDLSGPSPSAKLMIYLALKE